MWRRCKRAVSKSERSLGMGCNGLIVGDVDYGQVLARLQIANEGEYFCTSVIVESGGHLVTNQNAGPGGECAREGDSLPLPPG